jgi:hypothetical protein
MTNKSKNIPKRKVHPVNSIPNNNNINTSPTINTSTNNNGFVSNVVSGFALGTGVNLSDRLISSILGNRKIEVEEKKIDCSLEENREYPQCRKDKN